MPQRFTATSAGAGAAGSRGGVQVGVLLVPGDPQGFQDGLLPGPAFGPSGGAFVQVVIPQQVEDKEWTAR